MEACSHCHLESCTDSKSCSSLVQDKPFVTRLSQLDLQKVQDRPFVSRLSQLDLQKSCTKCNSETCRDSASCMSLSTNIPAVQACSDCNLESCQNPKPPRSISICKSANLNMNEPKFPNVKKGPKTNDQCNIC